MNYNEHYTEVQLLRQATASLQKNEDDTYCIQFLKTPAYREFYAPGMLNHDILAEELETACKLMGLTLLPNQDYHIGTLHFSAPKSLIKPSIDWFKKFSEMQSNFWWKMVSTLIGRDAPDGGVYNRSYTEIALLQQSTMHFNSDGSFELRFKNADAYHQHYAPHCRNHDILEEELRTACKFLGLVFLPEQNFHQKGVKFDAQSSLYLRNCGLHISESHCKALMRASHYFRLFRSVGDQYTEKNLSTLSPDNEKSVVLLAEPELSRDELEQMRNRFTSN